MLTARGVIMHTTGILYLRGRRGTSTILGTLIFIGIMFTAVIPMFLVIRQADMLFEKRKFELGILDEEKRNEDLYIYVSPTSILTKELKVEVQNRGVLSVKVVSLWVNDDYTPLDYTVQPMSGKMHLYTTKVVDPQVDESYFIMVTTDRGNMIAFDTPITWTPEGWKSDIYSINVLISYLPGTEFKIRVTGHEDVLTEKFDPKYIIVENTGTYTVTILRGSKTLYTEDVTISWPDSPVVWVFA